MGNQVVEAGSKISNEMAIGIGLGTVFVGLICLILICYIMGSLVRAFTKGDKKTAPAQAVAQTPVAQAQTLVANKGEFAAAIACAIAEDLGTDVTGIRIKSVKKL